MSIEQEILQYSYWEHFKSAKDLSHIFPPEHPKRVILSEAIGDVLMKLNKSKESACNRNFLTHFQIVVRIIV